MRMEKDRAFQSNNASICGDCLRCDCEWMMLKKPVPGWSAEPSKIYEDGYQVTACPKFDPMPLRPSDVRMGPENPAEMRT